MNTKANYKEIIGIDVSKDSFDAYLYFSAKHSKFNNEFKGFTGLLQWLKEKSSADKGQRLFIFEHTGVYSESLANFLSAKEEHFAIVSGLEVKRSIGIKRGKSDKIDARVLAEYGYRFQDKIELTKLASENLRGLKKLLSQREHYTKQLVEIKNRIKNLEEGKENLDSIEIKILDRDKQFLEEIKQFIKDIETQIDALLESDEQIKALVELIQTVPGVGKLTALYLIAYTEGFTKFKTWRKFASYIGIAPFPYSSGTSISGKTKVSHLANKLLKSKLYNVVLAAVRFDPELKKYYQRKLAEGKHTMSVLNAVKNKIIARVFAVVKRGTPYVNFMTFAN